MMFSGSSAAIVEDEAMGVENEAGDIVCNETNTSLWKLQKLEEVINAKKNKYSCLEYRYFTPNVNRNELAIFKFQEYQIVKVIIP